MMESLSLYGQLKILRWNVFKLPYELQRECRRNLHHRIRQVLPNVSTNPMPHGKVTKNLSSLFPQEDGRERWHHLLGRPLTWVIVPEAPIGPPLILVPPYGVLPSGPLPLLDIYLWTDPYEDVFSFGKTCTQDPLWLNPLMPPQILTIVDDVESSVPALGPQLGRKDFIKVKTWLKKALKYNRIYTPEYKLDSKGTSEDHLWNYLPVQHNVSIERGSIADSFLHSQPEVLFWTDSNDDAWVVKSTEVEHLKLYPHSYFLEWPQKRWLVAVPGSMSADGTKLSPSLVILERY